MFTAEAEIVLPVRKLPKIEFCLHKLRAVVLGRDLGARVEIISGVGLQDRLVLNPPDSLTSGAQVRISDLTKSADVPLHP